MGNVNIAPCNVQIAAPDCAPPSLPGKNEECLCTGALPGRALEPLSDQECADIVLVQAAVRGEVSDVIRALSLGASPNTVAELTLRMGEPSKKGRRGRAIHLTPLMRACELGHEDVALQLLDAKASPLQCDSHGWTPLCYALGAGEVGIATMLSQRPGFRLQQQKEICRKLRSEILSKCEKEGDHDALSAIKTEMALGGWLHDGTEHIKSEELGAVPDKVCPLYNESQDLLSGSYPYPGHSEA